MPQVVAALGEGVPRHHCEVVRQRGAVVEQQDRVTNHAGFGEPELRIDDEIDKSRDPAFDQRHRVVGIGDDPDFAGRESGMREQLQHHRAIKVRHGQGSAGELCQVVHRVIGPADDAERTLLELRGNDAEFRAGLADGRRQ